MGNRVQEIITRDNTNSPERTRLILASEIQRVVKDYLELKEDVRVRFKFVDEEIIFMVEMKAERIKNFGYLPH